MKKHLLSSEDRTTIEKLYPHHSTRSIAERLGLSERTVYNWAYNLGLKKSPEYMKNTLSRLARNLQESGKAHRFKKGDAPANKGRKMDASLYAKCSRTMFKAGHLPANTLHDGAETIRNDKNGHQYYWVRITLGKWMPKHIKLWQDANGPIPKGYNVVFRDGNTLNCVLENLECISNAELMTRNTLHNLPDDVKELVYLKGRLSRVIYKATNKDQ